MNLIEIKGYKSIKSLRLELKPINILIGANGSGKSNFLSFFEFLKVIYHKKCKEYIALKGGTDKFLHKGDKYTTQIETYLSFPNTNSYAFTLTKGDENMVFTKELLGYGQNPYIKNPIDISNFDTESRLTNSYLPPRAKYIQEYIQGLKKYHFHDTGANSPFNKESNIENDVFYLYEDGRNLASFLYNIQEQNPISYQLILKTIQSVAPYFLKFSFFPTAQGSLKLRWEHKESEQIYGVTDLSDGTIRFIALTSLFLQPNLPNTIIIDEPELGLHPVAIAKLAGMIQSVAKKGCQVIIATQSTDLIRHFETESIVTVDQIEGESHFKRLDSEELKIWLEEYSIDELWRKNLLNGGNPNF